MHRLEQKEAHYWSKIEVKETIVASFIKHAKLAYHHFILTME